MSKNYFCLFQLTFKLYCFKDFVNLHFPANIEIRFKINFMRTIIWRNGLISGTINGFWMLMLWVINKDNPNFENAMVYGYIAMAIALAFIFVGVWQTRNSLGDANFSFGWAFLTGLWITLISSVIYALAWLMVNKYLYPEFMADYSHYEMEKAKNSGLDEQLILEMKTEMEGYMKLYENPFWAFLITISEILPVGLLFSVVAGFTFKRKAK